MQPRISVKASNRATRDNRARPTHDLRPKERRHFMSWCGTSHGIRGGGDVDSVGKDRAPSSLSRLCAPIRRASRASGQTVAEHSVVLLDYRTTSSGPNQADPLGGTSPCPPRHRRLLWRRSHYSLLPVQRRRIERPRASRRTHEPYARLGSPGCRSNAYPAARCTKSPCVMRILMAPLMLWVNRTGSASGVKGSPDSHRPPSSTPKPCTIRIR